MCPLHSVDPYGFERSNDFDYDSYEELMSEYLAVLTKRSIKWSKLLQGKSRVEKSLKGEWGLLTYLEVTTFLILSRDGLNSPSRVSCLISEIQM